MCPQVVAVLEGGYNLDSISNWSEAVIRSLQGQKLPIEEINSKENAEQMFF